MDIRPKNHKNFYQMIFAIHSPNSFMDEMLTLQSGDA